MAKHLVKLAIRGHVASGKTAIVNALKGDVFSEHYQATLGAVIHILPFGEPDFRFLLWDLEGEHDEQRLSQDYLTGAKIVLLTADVTESSWAMKLDQLSALQKMSTKDACSIRVGCKADWSNKTDISLNAPCLLTSAQDGRGIQALKSAIIEQACELTL